MEFDRLPGVFVLNSTAPYISLSLYLLNSTAPYIPLSLYLLYSTDPDEDGQVKKVRPRVLPDPAELEYKKAPMSSWLQSSIAPPWLRELAAGGQEGGEKAQPEKAIGIGEEDVVDCGEGSKEVSKEEVSKEEVSTIDTYFGGDVEGGLRRDEIFMGEMSKEDRKEDRGEGADLGSDDEAVAVEDVGERWSAKRRNAGELHKNDGGVLKRPSMLDIMEGNLPQGRGEQGTGLMLDDETGELIFPSNMDEIMSEMKMLAQQDLDQRKHRHKHLQADEVEDDEQEEEFESEGFGGDIMVDTEEGDDEEELQDGDYDEKEEEFEGEGFGGDIMADTEEGDDDEAEAQARAELERMIAMQSNGVDERFEEGALWNRDPAGMSAMLPEELSRSDSQEGLVEHLGGEDEEEEEGDDWTPLMHEGLRDRTMALFGVVDLIEADVMEAAKRADEEVGYPRGGGTAGPAVHRTMRARLRCLTEARRCEKAIEFVEKEFPKEVRGVEEGGTGMEYGSYCLFLSNQGVFFCNTGIPLSKVFPFCSSIVRLEDDV